MDLFTITNLNIHEEVGLEPAEFLEKVQNVSEIRFRDSLAFTFYPSSDREIKNNQLLWEYVNGNLNALNTEAQKTFVVEFPSWLYLFLRFSTLQNMSKSIEVALTGLYVVNPERRKIMEDQLEPELMRRISLNTHDHFKEFEHFMFISSEDLSLHELVNEDYYKKEKRFQSRFDYFFRDNSGNPIILPYVYPIGNRNYHRTSIFLRNEFDVQLNFGYFSEEDWERIIEGTSTDDLKRAESKSEPWKQWKRDFCSYYNVY